MDKSSFLKNNPEMEWMLRSFTFGSKSQWIGNDYQRASTIKKTIILKEELDFADLLGGRQVTEKNRKSFTTKAPIRDGEMQGYFRNFGEPLHIPDFEIAGMVSDSKPERKKVDVGKMLVDTAKKIKSKIGKVKALFRSKGSKKGLEEASSTLFELVAEIEENSRNDGERSQIGVKKISGKNADTSRGEEVPESY